MTAASCTDEPAPDESLPVIEAFLSAGQHPNVFFTASVIPGVESDIEEKVIHWGKVTIEDLTDGTRAKMTRSTDGNDSESSTVILTGGMAKQELIPYHYYSYDITGMPGHTYRITASYRDLHAETTATIPMARPVVNRIDMTSKDGLSAVSVVLEPPTDLPAYYVVAARDRSQKLQTYGYGMLCTATATVPDEEIIMPVNHARIIGQSNTDFTSDWLPGTHLDIRVSRISEEVYQFWSNYDSMLTFGHNQFFAPTTNLPCNITGGYGIFTAANSVTLSITVP